MNRQERRKWAKDEMRRQKAEERHNHNLEMSKQLGITPEAVDYYSHIPLAHVAEKDLDIKTQRCLFQLFKVPVLRWINWECFHSNARIKRNIYPSFDDIKSLPRLELDRGFIGSYLASFDNEYKQKDGTTSGKDTFRFAIPPFEHGVIRIMDDTVWIEWQLMTLNESDFDICFYCWQNSVDRYKNHFENRIMMPSNDDNSSCYVDINIDVPEYLLLVYKVVLNARYNSENNMFEIAQDNDLTCCYEELCESALMIEEQAYADNKQSAHPLDLTYDEKVTELVRDYYSHNVVRDAEEITAYMQDVEFDNLKFFIAFNYAAEINARKNVDKKQNHIYYNYELTDDMTEIKAKVEQLSLSSENGGTARLVTLDKTQILRKLKPIEWTRRGHYRHYKNGKVIWIRSSKCHWAAYSESQISRQQKIIRLTDIDGEVSSLERYTTDYLDNKNIIYKAQYSFSDLQGEHGILRFDFGIKVNNEFTIFIECQGEQHYHPVDIFGGEEQFEKQQKYDILKVNYCEAHNLTLLCIDGRKIKTESDVTNWLDENLMPLIEK